MKSKLTVLVALISMVGFVGSASACDKHKTAKAKGGCGSKAEAKAPCHGKGKTVELTSDKAAHGNSKPCPHAGESSKEEGCPISAKVKTVLSSLPSIKYRVGDETTCCHKSATAMAEKAGTPMKYVVGEDVFDSEGEAKGRLVSLLESEIEKMSSVQYAVGESCGRCPMTAKRLAKEKGTKVAYRVGGFDFPEKEQAEKVAKLVSDSLKEVKMSYKVGDKSFCCDKMAGAASKKSGKKMAYVVGEQETGCPTTAKLMLAQAKLRTIVETAGAQFAGLSF